MSAIRASTRGPQPESSFGEVEADSRIASDAVEVAPDNMGSIHATLHDEIFDEPAQVVPRQTRHHCGALAKALAHYARVRIRDRSAASPLPGPRNPIACCRRTGSSGCHSSRVTFPGSCGRVAE